jgi:hypothetical protein
MFKYCNNPSRQLIRQSAQNAKILSACLLADSINVLSVSNKATNNDPKQIEPKLVVIALFRDFNVGFSGMT